MVIATATPMRISMCRPALNMLWEIPENIRSGQIKLVLHDRPAKNRWPVEGKRIRRNDRLCVMWLRFYGNDLPPYLTLWERCYTFSRKQQATMCKKGLWPAEGAIWARVGYVECQYTSK